MGANAFWYLQVSIKQKCWYFEIYCLQIIYIFIYLFCVRVITFCLILLSTIIFTRFHLISFPISLNAWIRFSNRFLTHFCWMIFLKYCTQFHCRWQWHIYVYFRCCSSAGTGSMDTKHSVQHKFWLKSHTSNEPIFLNVFALVHC